MTHDATIRNSQLAEIAANINGHHGHALEHATTALEHARQAGELLAQAKALLPHGQWLPWLSERCSVSARQAQRYMRVAENWTAISKNDATSHLAIDDALSEVGNESKLEQWIQTIESLPSGIMLESATDDSYSIIFRVAEHANHFHLYRYLLASEPAEAIETRRAVRARGVALMLLAEGDDIAAYEQTIDDSAEFRSKMEAAA